MPRKSEPNIKNNIRELRLKQNGMTQQILADKVNVTRQTIISLEGGAYTPSLTLALRIARTFKLPVEEVFYLDE